MGWNTTCSGKPALEYVLPLIVTFGVAVVVRAAVLHVVSLVGALNHWREPGMAYHLFEVLSREV
eukprot:2665818-Pyramimonas_sp.AAC.1